MARCWTCGSLVGGYSYTCPACRELEEIKGLRQDLQSAQGDLAQRLDQLAAVQERGLQAVAESLSGVAAAIEWGFGELTWQLKQQTEVLQSIDRTLKTPRQTEANELRQMAEELRQRGVLPQAERFFMRALEENPLDYRTYVGLAYTYLQMEDFDKARALLEESLPHAPRTGRSDLPKGQVVDGWVDRLVLKIRCQYINPTSPIPPELMRKLLEDDSGTIRDYRSYSLRLIGHTHFCGGGYTQAASVLASAVALSPGYHEAIYDLAQYRAQEGNVAGALSSLQEAVARYPLYSRLAERERSFDAIRPDVRAALAAVAAADSPRVTSAVMAAQNAVREAEAAHQLAKEAWRKAPKESWQRDRLADGERARRELLRLRGTYGRLGDTDLDTLFGRLEKWVETLPPHYPGEEYAWMESWEPFDVEGTVARAGRMYRGFARDWRWFERLLREHGWALTTPPATVADQVKGWQDQRIELRWKLFTLGEYGPRGYEGMSTDLLHDSKEALKRALDGAISSDYATLLEATANAKFASVLAGMARGQAQREQLYHERRRQG